MCISYKLCQQVDEYDEHRNEDGDDHLFAKSAPFRQDDRFRQISGNVLVQRGPQREFFFVQPNIHLVVDEPDPAHKRFAVVEIGSDRILIQHAAKCIAHFYVRQKIRHVLDQIVVCAFDRGIGRFGIIVGDGM